MPVCSYYLRGNCKFGDSCRNEHPRGAFGNLSWTSQNRNEKTQFPFTPETLTKDLTALADKPSWPLSSYGPAKGEPNLLGGLDESPEELRVRAVKALRAGNANEYIAYESGKINAAEGVYANARSNIQQAHDSAVKQSPYSSLFDSTKSTIFNKPAPAFGASSAFGAPKSAFGQPAFGQTGFSTTPSTFGQPAASTSTVTGAFGQPVQAPPTSTATGAFGQPVQAPSTSAFGQLAASTSMVTGAFGQPIQPPSTSAFGQTSQPQSSVIKPATGAFSNFATGQSAFNTAANGATTGGGFSAFAGRPSAFGLGATAAQTTGGTTFGQPSFGAPSAFGALAQQQQQSPPTQPQSAFSAFAQPATTPAQTKSAFGASPPAQTTAFGRPAQTASAFGAVTSGTVAPAQGFSAFGARPAGTSATVPGISGFGAAQPALSTFSAFGQPTTAAGTRSLFGQSSQPARGLSGFGPTTRSAFGASQPAPGAGAKKPLAGKPDFDQIIAAGLHSLSTAGTNSALYKAGATPYDEQLGPNYMGILPKEALEAFKSKAFELGKVPECTPPVEMR